MFILDPNLIMSTGAKNCLNNYNLTYNGYHKIIFYEFYSQNEFFLTNYSNIGTPTRREHALSKIKVYYIDSLNCNWWYLIRVEPYLSLLHEVSLSMFDIHELPIVELSYQIRCREMLLNDMANSSRDLNFSFKIKLKSQSFPPQKAIWKYLLKIAKVPQLSNFGDITSNRVFFFIFYKF